MSQRLNLLLVLLLVSSNVSRSISTRTVAKSFFKSTSTAKITSTAPGPPQIITNCSPVISSISINLG